jgi:tRNA dimethylallyltransferase
VSAADERGRANEAARLAAEIQGQPHRLLCIVGPTASGKSDLAIAIAERIGGVIVSADSVQVYRGFDIGSGKPSAEEVARAPHRLVSTHDPLSPLDAASWAKLAEDEIARIRADGRIPIVCGGTFFWVRALVLGLVPAPAADETIRARHRAIALAEGRPALHALLAQVDPESAARLHPNDVVRVSRALEVHELSGRRMSEWQADHGFRSQRHDARMVALRHEPTALTTRITERVRRMLAAGWLAEVSALVEAGYDEARAMRSVGYAEVRAHLRGDLPEAGLEDTIVRATRIFARRQRTWLNHTAIEWL